MTSPLMISENWDVWGDERGIQQQQRGRSLSQYSHQHRPRARSADARPQYASSTFRRQNYQRAFPYESTPATLADEIVVVPEYQYHEEVKFSSDNPHPSNLEPQHSDPFRDAWGPADDKFRWEQATQSGPFPDTQEPSNSMQQRDQVPTIRGRGKSGLRSSIMKSSMVQKLKGVRKSSSSSGRRPWNLIPSLSRSRSLSPTSSSGSRIPPRGMKEKASTQQLPKDNNNVPLPARRSLNSKERIRDGGSFDVDYDFLGDGFAEANNTVEHEVSQSDGFTVIRRTEQPARTAPPQSRAQYPQHAMTGATRGTAPISYSEYISKSKVKGSNHGPFKISPTSVTDINNAFSVRWSDNLSQSPTRTPNGSRRPKSILRASRLNHSNSSDDYASVETPTIEFVDPTNGLSLSPIRQTHERVEEMPKWMETDSMLEKNVPHEYQQAFYQQSAQANSRNDDSGVISEAYNEFIESVASVVLQTAVRQFLARARVRRIREETAAARKYKYNRKRIQRSSGVKSVRSQDSRTDMIAKAKHENQLFQLAAIRIQSIFRGWWARDFIKVDHYCASIIQKNFRAYRCRNLFLYDLYRVVVVQSVVRRYIVRKSFGYSEQDLVIRRALDFAAAIIQSQWRCFSTEIRFLRTYRDILIVQSVVRGWLVRRRMESRSRERTSRGSLNLATNYGSRLRLAHMQKMSAKRSYLPSQGLTRQSFPTGSESAQEEPTANPELSKIPAYGGRLSHGITRTKSQSDDSWLTKSIPRKETKERPATAFGGGQANQKGKTTVGKTDIEKRREAKERERREVVEEEKQRKEREVLHAAELKRMQQRVGVVKTQSSPPMKNTSSARSTIDIIDAQNQNSTWRSKSHRYSEVQGIRSSDSFDSDKETEIQSNRTSTSRLMDGWRNRERSNSLDRKSFGDKTSERIREIESQGNERLSMIGGRVPSENSNTMKGLADANRQEQAGQKGVNLASRPKKSPRPKISQPSIQQILRAKRSDGENLRIDRIHATFLCVGLMHPIEYAPDETLQNPEFGTVRQVGKGMEVDQKQKAPLIAEEKQQFISATSSLVKTERRLFVAEGGQSNERGIGEPSATTKKLRSSYPPPRKELGKPATAGRNQRSSYPPPTNSRRQNSTALVSKTQVAPGIERSKQLMQSLGLNTSYASEASTDVSDVEDERTNPVVSTRSTMLASPEPKRDAKAKIQFPPKTLTSEIYLQMKAKRSEQDQLRIDQMHEIFQQVGLMHRHSCTKSKTSAVSMANSISKQIESNSSDPTATDLIKSWRQRDHTQPRARGKLF